MNKVLFSSASDEWSTPEHVFNWLYDQFHFTLDVAASAENAKCKRYFDKSIDGLSQSWQHEVVFCNPPYGRSLYDWVKKACFETAIDCTCVMLIPARTDTRWFHDFVLPYAHVIFIQGRLKFGNAKNFAPFPSMIVVFNPHHIIIPSRKFLSYSF